MKTLIFNGSPRPQGDTAALIAALTGALGGEIDAVDCYASGIRPCVDCRACKAEFRCAIDDEMRAVYRLILDADNVVIASPVYFSQLTGPLLGVLSRLQPGYYARRRGEAGFFNRPRRGGILLAGGGNGSPAPAVDTARTLLRAMGCRTIAEPVVAFGTDRLPAARDTAALASARALGAAWNR